jgi:peptide chain release factor 1
VTQISPERIASIEAKKQEIADAMASGTLSPDDFVRLSKEYAQIEPSPPLLARFEDCAPSSTS